MASSNEKTRNVTLSYAEIRVWSGVTPSVCTLAASASVDASCYDYSEVTENGNFQIQLAGTCFGLEDKSFLIHYVR